MNNSDLPSQSSNLKFTCSNFPDSIAHELESQDELYYWTDEGTLVSEDGKKTIPSSVGVKKSEIITETSSTFRIDPQGVNAIPSHQNQEYGLDKSSLSIIMSSLNLMLLFWFWLQFGS